MRQTLFHIPIDGAWSPGPFGEVPGFGFGVVLACWAIFGAIWLYRHRSAWAAPNSLLSPAAVWLAIAVVIVLVPWYVHRSANAALSAADRILADHPQSVEALFARANANFSKRDYAKAAEDLQNAIKVDPLNAVLLNRLAWIQATCPDPTVRDGKAAVENAQKACARTSSRNPEYLATLAAAHAESGQFSEAVDVQRQALRLFSTAPEAAEYTGEIPRMRRQLQLAEEHRPFRDRSAGTNLPIFGFGAMLFLGFVAGAWTAGRRGARIGYTPEMMWDIGIWIFISGIVGCRVFYCIQYAPKLFYHYVGDRPVLKSFPDLLYAAINLPDGGLVYYGGIPAAFLVAWWICKRRNLSLLALGDVVIPSLFLGMAFGRIGCFLNGCCYGDRCELPWGVEFPMGSVPDTALVARGFVGAAQDLTFRLHPTQLYSSLDGFFLFLLTGAYFTYRPRNGAVIALGALTYPLTRFAIESLRGDELGQFNTTLTISQWISIGMFAVGIGFAIWLSRQPKLSPPVKNSVTQVRATAPCRPTAPEATL